MVRLINGESIEYELCYKACFLVSAIVRCSSIAIWRAAIMVIANVYYICFEPLSLIVEDIGTTEVIIFIISSSSSDIMI